MVLIIGEVLDSLNIAGNAFAVKQAPELLRAELVRRIEIFSGNVFLQGGNIGTST